jgi:hypothetical protein
MNQCKNCQNLFTGKFCNQCGQKVYHETDKSVMHLIEEIFHFLTHFEGSFLTSVKTILLHPGKLSLDYCAGIRKKYYKPISLFLMVVIIYLLNPMYSGLNQEFRHYKGNNVYGPMAKAAIEHKLSNSTLTENGLATAYASKSKSVSKALLFIFILTSTVFLYVLFFKQRKWLFDHMILSTEINTIFILLIFILFPIFLILLRVVFQLSEDVLPDEIFSIISFIIFVIYNGIAFKTMFKESTIRTIIKSLLFTLSHIVFFVFVYRIIVFKVTLWFI